MAEASRPTTEDDMRAGQRSIVPMGGGGSNAPPDPSAATTDAIRREIAALTVLISTRLDAMDKAVEVLQAGANREPTTAVLEERRMGLHGLMMQMFQTDSVKFTELDKRTEALTAAGKIAIDAAFKAQQEAAGKQESQFTKQVDQLRELFQNSINSLTVNLNDLKSRLDRGEGKSTGTEKQTDRSSQVLALVFSGTLAMIGVIVFILTRLK